MAQELSAIYDELGQAYSDLSDSRDAESSAKQTSGVLATNILDLENKLDLTSKQLQSAEVKLADFHRDFADLAEENDALKSASQSMDHARKFAAELEETKQKLLESDENFAFLCEAAEVQKLQLETTNQNLHDLVQVCDEKNMHLTNIEAELSIRNERLSCVEAELSHCRNLLIAKDTELGDKMVQLSRLETNLRELQELLVVKSCEASDFQSNLAAKLESETQEAQRLESITKILQERLSEKDQEITRLQAEMSVVNTSESKTAEAEAQTDGFPAEIPMSRELAAELSQTYDELGTVYGELSNAQKDLNVRDSELEALKIQYQNCILDFGRFKQSSREEVQTLTAKVEAAEAQAKLVQDQSINLSQDIKNLTERFENKNAVLTDAQNKLSATQFKLVETTSYAEDLKGKLQQVNSELTNMTSKLPSFEDINKQLAEKHLAFKSLHQQVTTLETQLAAANRKISIREQDLNDATNMLLLEQASSSNKKQVRNPIKAADFSCLQRLVFFLSVLYNICMRISIHLFRPNRTMLPKWPQKTLS